ncbi:hypothetical protein PR202_ga28789 [Eleusine coracana subsp. coracana]|uniref:Polymerase nucleotidyl transferase domain-containing protein n=1 Tax=Eleusine coracana subsp. coracana TaxID=191504 RepID=A0AAV5DJ57_ELECO|nr:hypothetical protein PR202_ga28789 [Eleusine coracana subsp. coracana]
MAFHGGRGRGTWFEQQQQAGAAAAGMSAFPWGRGAGAGGTTLAQVMASRAPEPSMIRRDAVRAAEAAAREVALRVHPTQEAERRRQDVVGYLKRLLGSTFGFEVFAFGSVPLKTYLPDGDVDITVLANTWMKSSLIDDVRYVLKMEMENCDAEFEVKGLHFIDADVKLLKCVVENIVVDISFNQIGGVSTFCFLELIDRQLGKDHLFKRSIMLIKAWCYHESRILGAHHGLISTYALETLVLYIFNLFHKSLHGPLEALYRFLEYFSKFDWDTYGISLFGPVHLSAFPDITIESTVPQDELLLGHGFLQSSSDRIVVNGSNGRDTNFRLKFLNIIDPLKGNNNLGRSVSKGSFYRIRSAFSFGAQKLGQILMLPSELIPGEICGFFSNTLKRHGNGERPDLGDYSSFESLLGPENAPGEHLSSLKMSCITEGENRSSCNGSSKLADNESKGAHTHKNSSTYLQGDAQGLPWNKIWFMEYASDFGANSSYLASVSSHSSSSQQNEKMSLPPFSLSDMLDVSGDLNLHLGSLRKVHYHLEYMFNELRQEMQEAYLAGEIDEDFFKAPTVSLETRPQRITIASSTGTETWKLSPVYCSHRTEDVSQQSHVEDQADAVWLQNMPLSTNGFSFSSPPVSNSDSYPVSWLSVSPKSHGTGTYIPRVTPDMYKERMAPERGSMRRQKPRQADRHYYTHDPCSVPRNEHTAFQGATYQLSVKQKGSLQDVDSSKNDDPKPKGGFLQFGDQTATACGTKQTATNLSKTQASQDIPSSPCIDNSSKNTIEKERQIKPQSPGMVLPHCGQGNPPAPCQPSLPAAASYSQLKSQVVENLEFGSMGPFSLQLLSARFEEAFPPLPSIKKPAPQAPAPAVQSPEPVVTQSRPQEAYQLRDESEFPPLKAGCR